jgi:hypothetical protein
MFGNVIAEKSNIFTRTNQLFPVRNNPVKMLNQNGMLDCSCLASTQEEADTRVILHALHSDKLYQENNVQGRIVVTFSSQE